MSEKLITQGIASPTENWFKCPLELIEYLPGLSEKELKTFLYIVRHTWGYHDDEKKITLDEFEHGRKRRNGTRIDNGCGLSKPSIIGALALLEEKGFINCRSNGDKAREKKFYSLRLKILTPETENVEQGSKIFTPEQPVRGKKSLHRSEKDTLKDKKKDTSKDSAATASGASETPQKKETSVQETTYTVQSPELKELIAGICYPNLDPKKAVADKASIIVKALKKVQSTAPELFNPDGIRKWLQWWYDNDFRGKQGELPKPHLIASLWIDFYNWHKGGGKSPQGPPRPSQYGPQKGQYHSTEPKPPKVGAAGPERIQGNPFIKDKAI